MPLIRYIDGPTIEATDGEAVLDASIRTSVDHMHACGGDCRCSTCRVEVVEGAEHCPEPSTSECEVLAMNGLSPPVRLACQLRPTGDIAVRVLLRESDQPLRPSLAEGLAQEREVAVLFADLRNFTGFAEQHLPFDVLHLLNRYFDRMGGIVERHHGHVVSYQGDGMLALFPAGGTLSALGAVQCGLLMAATCEELSGYSREHFDFELRAGVGIDFGRALVGQIGYYRNTHLNAIGDVVNTASRVQELTKQTGATVLVTEAVRDRVAEHFTFGREFTTDIRGKTGRHCVYEVTGAK